ncbi:MAG: FKBP-type peptidyl-prolyl cis-trans isomerase [Prevotellaceae bacterium]|jgi:FKBP-type peptidyl-prolyl cis-trans isomerase SlyD|nr:FKBP-type peptidyl-prolyl cis-trans isomerase [Prevotellaceae bacterium]
MKISDNKLVTLEYQLFVQNSNGSKELMEETTAEKPLTYFHGLGMMMPKFEQNLFGREAGETFEFEVACADAYGEYSNDNIIELPYSVFSEDEVLDSDKVFKGAVVPLIDSTGQRINAEVVEIGKSSVTVDLNHPLAGEDLFFTGKIIDVHTPTEDELQALTSCNCGSCNCGNCGGCN